MAIDTQTATVEKDVTFGRGGNRDLCCDIYRPPEGRTKRTAVVHIHGGAFRRGSKEGARAARPLAGLGYTGIAIQYRLAQEAPWPAQIEDVKAAIRWTRARADWPGVDPHRIAVVGYSAGGHLALVAAGSPNLPDLEGDGGNAGVDSRVAACIGFYPRSIVPPAADRGDYPLLQADRGQEAYRGIRPLSYVNPRFPPTLLLHGTADESIPIEESVHLYEALKAEHVPVEIHIIDGVTHMFDVHADLAEMSALWIDLFLDRHVVNPRTYPSTEPPKD